MRCRASSRVRPQTGTLPMDMMPVARLLVPSPDVQAFEFSDEALGNIALMRVDVAADREIASHGASVRWTR